MASTVEDNGTSHTVFIDLSEDEFQLIEDPKTSIENTSAKKKRGREAPNNAERRESVTDLLSPTSKIGRMTNNPSAVINYKIYLCAPGYEPEIRRLTVDKDISTNYFYLKQKLINIFPAFKDVPFTVTWKDLDGDNVRICTDEELGIALKELEGSDLKKIYISTTPQQGTEGPLHPGVMCDGCDNHLVGFRYKCIVCNDLDLCPDCERSQMHPEHPMIRIPLPLSLEMPFGRRFSRDLHKMSKHLERLLHNSQEHIGERWGDRKGRGDWGRKDHHKGRKGGCPFNAGPHGFFQDNLSELIANFSGFRPPRTQRQENPEPEPEQPTPPQAQPPVQDPPTPNPYIDEQRKFVEILRHGLTSFLDPLGVDVTVEEGPVREEPTKHRGEEKKQPQQSHPLSTPPQPTPQPQLQPQPQAPVQQTSQNIPVEILVRMEEDAPPTYPELATQLPGSSNAKEDTPILDSTWTVVSGGGSGDSIMLDAKQQSQAPPTAETASAPTRLYPDIEPGPKSNIDIAMDGMLKMGFVEEGGWLRQLVESKQGDLEEVLRFLSPIPQKPTSK